MKYQVVILDFDGVIVESVGIKDEAFRQVFSDFPKHLDTIMRYHTSNNAIIRYEKFRHVYEEILEKEYTAEIATDLNARFSKIIFSQIVACPFVKGAEKLLKALHGKTLMYLVSINPPQELKNILVERKLDVFFSDVYAHPWAKTDAIREILRRNDFLAQDAVFIGDSPEDKDAAVMAGIDFIARQSNKPWTNYKGQVFNDLTQVSEYLGI